MSGISKVADSRALFYIPYNKTAFDMAFRESPPSKRLLPTRIRVSVMKRKNTWRILGLMACLLLGLVTVSCHKDKDEEQARIVFENAEVVTNKVSTIFMSSESVDEMAEHLDDIKAIENVEDAWQEDSTIRVKIKDGGIISWVFFSQNSEEKRNDSNLLNTIENTTCWNTKNSSNSLCENRTMCIIDAVPYDEDRNLKSELSQIESMFKSQGFRTRIVEGQSVTLKYLCDSMPKYGVIVLLAHGNRYGFWNGDVLNYPIDFFRGKHWLMTGTLFTRDLYKRSDYNEYWNGQLDFWYDWSFGNIQKTVSKEKRNGEIVKIEYLSVNEDFLREKMRSKFSDNSILFAVSCRTLYNDYGLWEVFQEKNLGCYFGYDEYVQWVVGVRGCASVMNSMLNGKTASEAYQAVPANGRHDNYTGANLILCPANSDITLVEKPDYGDDWVDLGLPSGLLWATRNVGASSPEDYGDYFAWGETTPKEEYYWDTYRYCNGSDNTLTKYCTKSNYGYNGFHDTLTILQPGDDAATANYGGRTPTNDEWRELKENTTHKWMTINEVNGLRFTGTNGNSLFLPAAGYYRLRYLFADNDYGYYWSNSLHEINPTAAEGYEIFDFYYYEQGEIYYYGGHEDVKSREIGLPVRAVRSTR